jgi:hypothetical protein
MSDSIRQSLRLDAKVVHRRGQAPWASPRWSVEGFDFATGKTITYGPCASERAAERALARMIADRAAIIDETEKSFLNLIDIPPREAA